VLKYAAQQQSTAAGRTGMPELATIPLSVRAEHTLERSPQPRSGSFFHQAAPLSELESTTGLPPAHAQVLVSAGGHSPSMIAG
jgi:hypothetical protein